MMKRLISFICCLAPLGAGAETITVNPGDNVAYSAGAALTATDNSYVIQSGNGIVAGDDGIDVGNSMYIGMASQAGTSGGFVYVEPATNNPYTIRTDGNVSIGSLLQVLTGRTLGIHSYTDGAEIAEASFGQIIADGALTISNVKDFTAGTISSKDALSITAGKITAGAITSAAGNTTLAATDKLTMAQLIAQGAGAVTNISAGSIESGDIQNGAGAGMMTIDVGSGALTIAPNGGAESTGSLENSGAGIKVTAGAVTVGGTVKNDAGTMTINASSLAVNGGSATNPSLVNTNSGVMNITVAGESVFANDLYVNGAGAQTSLTTGTLVLNGATHDILNDSSKFVLTVTNGGVDLMRIVNSATVANANMDLIAQSVKATAVLNHGGELNIKTADGSNGAINITGQVAGDAASSVTNIISDGALTIADNVSNQGTMVLNGQTVSAKNISNSGEALHVLAYTDKTGSVMIGNRDGANADEIGGNVTNTAGQTVIEGRNIAILGTVLNQGGDTTIRGSDTSNSSIEIGAIDVEAGTVNLDALIGAANIAKDLKIGANGAMNIMRNLYSLTVDQDVNIAGDVTVAGSAATGNGNVNIDAGSQKFSMTSTNGVINVAGGIDATSGTGRVVTFDASNIDIKNNVAVSGDGNKLVFGSDGASTLAIGGNVSANNLAAMEIFADDIDVGTLTGDGKFIVLGSQITAKGENVDGTTAAIDIKNGLWFAGKDEDAGLVVDANQKSLHIETVTAGADIAVDGGAAIGADNVLTVSSAGGAAMRGDIDVDGTLNVTAANGDAVFNGVMSMDGTLDVTARNVMLGSIKNNGTATISATAGDVAADGIENTASLTMSGINFDLGAVSNSGTGVIDINGLAGNSVLTATAMTVTGGQVNLDVADMHINGIARVLGDLYQGVNKSGMLNISNNNAKFAANSLDVGGKLFAESNSVEYEIGGVANIAGGVLVKSGAGALLSANTITSGDINNSGILQLNSAAGSKLGTIDNIGTLTLGSGTGMTSVARFTNTSAGTVVLSGAGMDSTGAFTTPGILYQNYDQGTFAAAGDVNVISTNYVLNASDISLAGINQSSGRMILNTSDITVGGNIAAKDLRIAANPVTNWLKVNVNGSVSGGVQFIGLEEMSITGNYTFNDNSIIHAAILGGKDSAVDPYTYWADVSLANDNTLGQITNVAGAAAKPLISVGGQFISNVTTLGNGAGGGALKDGQVGIDIFNVVNPGTAIWLLKADEGLTDLATKIRNLNVNFCNADGSLCFSYFDSLKLNNNSGTADGTPAYISVRDSDDDGTADSLYIVFDPRFGGPVEVFRIQPVVARESYHTSGEFVSAGALDNLIIGQLRDYKFYNRTPIEAIPLVFRGTNMEYLAKELYNRMEQYNIDRNGAGLARFSRLMQAREIEQIAGSVALNEHTSFRSFEDHMFDEFIWNRHRNLKKAWMDVDFGMFSQKVEDGKRADGNRFSITGGFDWQDSPTLILGLTGRVSHMSSDNSDDMDLGYLPGQSIAGHVKMDVADTNIGIGGYLIKTLGLKTRAYGNAFLDAHIFDVSREQNYVSNIDGTGTAFSLISEWGLMHDLLNQYIVGNVYARVGYNFGFSVKEKAAGDDYMRLKSDGYAILTPGYSLIAQKRIYPSSWFQIRPYASIGIEYDVLGAPDEAKYKFAPAKSYTKYDINIDPMWANIGGGVELISAKGIQVGLDYRYQYNTDIQLHNIKVSGSYRF